MSNTSNHMLHNIYIYKKNPLDFLVVGIFFQKGCESCYFIKKTGFDNALK
ncbi:hypothetical protein NB694_000575 [Pantoea ananatis]|nr:hypothetical protein [Pantoea ananatis]